MIYLTLLTILMLAGLNLYASVIIVRARYATNKSKLLQMGFVWVLPIFGSVFAVSLLKETHRSSAGLPATKEMRSDDSWYYSQSECGRPPEFWNHASDHLCD